MDEWKSLPFVTVTSTVLESAMYRKRQVPTFSYTEKVAHCVNLCTEHEMYQS